VARKYTRWLSIKLPQERPVTGFLTTTDRKK
jgi:hypothetical protein